MSLTDVLPTEPGDADHLGAEPAPPGAGQGLQRRERIAADEDPAPPRPAAARRSAGRPRRPRRPAASPPRRTRRRRPLAPRRPKKRSPGPASPRVDHGPRRELGRPPARTIWRPSPRRSAPVLSDFTRPAQLLASHLAVVEGDLAAALELLALLVALAGDHDGVARAAPARGQRDRGAAVGLDLHPAARPSGAGEDLADDRLGVLRARVVRGDDRQVGEPAPPGPSSGACRDRGRRRRRRP